tara:strand:+ start:225 stop:473 length:249 start_codon:yes stop_codon:yes gene_type:complete
MTVLLPFHLAFAVTDIKATHLFYIEKLGCKVDRSEEGWIDFDFFGHQVSALLVDDELSPAETIPVDGEEVSSQHYGTVLNWD